jgi:hypothetical protein
MVFRDNPQGSCRGNAVTAGKVIWNKGFSRLGGFVRPVGVPIPWDHHPQGSVGGTLVTSDDDWRPETKFPFVGKPGNRLYRQGVCKICRLLLMGEQPIRRDYCGMHDPGTHNPGSTGKTLSLSGPESGESPGSTLASFLEGGQKPVGTEGGR